MTLTTMQYGSLQMSLPQGWSDATQIVASGPVEDGFRSTLGYTTETLRPRETPPMFAQRMLMQTKQNSEGFQMVGERTATFGSNAGFLREFTCVANGMKVGKLQFFVVRGNVVHIFTFTNKAERMQVSRPTAEKMFASAYLSAPEAVKTSANSAVPASMRSRPKYIEPRLMRLIAA
jgi:hypothetical protein